MSLKPVRPPKALGSAGVDLWRRCAKQWAEDGLVPDARERYVLELAAGEADMMRRLIDALEGQPATVLGAQKQLVAHPLFAQVRSSRTTVVSFLRQLGFSDEADDEHKPGRGGRTTSWQARAAANVRHGGSR